MNDHSTLNQNVKEKPLMQRKIIVFSKKYYREFKYLISTNSARAHTQYLKLFLPWKFEQVYILSST